MPEHTVFIDTIGGTTVLSCQELGIKNIEYPHKEMTEEGIKETILTYKFMKKDAEFDINIIDDRPEPENYNEMRERESKQFKKNRNDMKAAKM